MQVECEGDKGEERSREAASRIAQFGLSHAPINQHLKRIRWVDGARCPACRANEETIEHFLLHCPSYAHERWTLEQPAKEKRKRPTLETMLGDQGMILLVPLANYMEVTHQFRRNGE